MNRLRELFVTGVFAAVVTVCVLLVRDGSVQPVRASSHASKAAGAALFHERGCEHCHGVDGVGADKGPELTTIGKRWKAGKIEQQIREGGNGMPAFGSILQPDEVKSLVDYLKAKKKAPRDASPVSLDKPNPQAAE